MNLKNVTVTSFGEKKFTYEKELEHFIVRYIGLTQVKCRLLNSSIFYAMNF